MEDTEIFIECVKNFPCIWNMCLPSYKCNTTKDNAWSAIMHETGISDIQTAKYKWKKLRDSFRESVKKQKSKNGPSSKAVRSYKYHHVMEFLLPTFENGETITHSVQTPDYHHSIESENSCSSLDSSQCTDTKDLIITNSNNIIEIEAHSQKPSAGKRKKNNNDVLDFHIEDGKREQERFQITQQLMTDENPIDKFFSSMSQSTKNLPEFLQLQVKRKVFNAVIEAEEAHSNSKHMLYDDHFNIRSRSYLQKTQTQSKPVKIRSASMSATEEDSS